MTIRTKGVFSPRSFKSQEEATEEARKWAESHPVDAENAIAYLRTIVSQAPIHASLLGEVGERFGIPRPVSAFYRMYCDDIVFASPTITPVKCPTVCLRGRLNDPAYWAGFKRRGLTPASEHGDVNPWLVLGIDGATTPFNEQRVLIFEAFLLANYGAGNLRDMAGVCMDFKKQTGITFTSFFNGLRPADLQQHPFASQRLNWSWSTSNPPCLSCSAKIRFAPPPGDVVASKDHLVAELLPLAGARMPDYGINFEHIAERNGTNEQSVMVSYLVALKKVFQAKLLHDADNRVNLSTDSDRLAQIYQKARFAEEQARIALNAARAVIRAIEEVAPAVTR